MIKYLSLNIITKNAGKTLEKTILSAKDLVNEIVIVDDYSTDNTKTIAEKYKAKFFLHHQESLGKQRQYALSKAKGEWILVLDSDETISEKLKNEIIRLFDIRYSILKNSEDKQTISNTKYLISNINGYNIPFQTHFLGRPLRYGGENYSKMILFKKDAVKCLSLEVHEKYQVVTGKTGKLKNVVYHYSYESLIGLYKKFTFYSQLAAKQKYKEGEKSGLKKIILYPVHMFWSRFIVDKGYKDGIFRLPLDLAFAYMEFLTYFLLLLKK